MKPFNLKAAAAVAALGCAALQAQAGVTITIACGTVGQDFDFCKKSADEWSAKTGNAVISGTGRSCRVS